MLEIFDHIQNTFSILFMLSLTVTSMVAQTVKCLPTMPETRVQSLGREDILEKRMATHSSVLASSPPPQNTDSAATDHAEACQLQRTAQKRG